MEKAKVVVDFSFSFSLFDEDFECSLSNGVSICFGICCIRNISIFQSILSPPQYQYYLFLVNQLTTILYYLKVHNINSFQLYKSFPPKFHFSFIISIINTKHTFKYIYIFLVLLAKSVINYWFNCSAAVSLSLSYCKYREKERRKEEKQAH